MAGPAEGASLAYVKGEVPALEVWANLFVAISQEVGDGSPRRPGTDGCEESEKCEGCVNGRVKT